MQARGITSRAGVPAPHRSRRTGVGRVPRLHPGQEKAGAPPGLSEGRHDGPWGASHERPTHARNHRPHPSGSKHQRPQSPASPVGEQAPTSAVPGLTRRADICRVEQPPMTARERARDDWGPTTAAYARQGRGLRTLVLAPRRARPTTADVGACSPTGEAGDCGRACLLPDGRGRGLRTLVLAPRRARPGIADVGACSPTGEAGDCGRRCLLPDGRGRGLRACVLAPRRARPVSAGVRGSLVAWLPTDRRGGLPKAPEGRLLSPGRGAGAGRDQPRSGAPRNSSSCGQPSARYDRGPTPPEPLTARRAPRAAARESPRWGTSPSARWRRWSPPRGP
ncbi:MAG: hypothetical protein JWM10_1248 [Myxococcaceae bacterium]|nr:hypothetical protein [Myxococcaceae bacterium]